MVIDGIILSVIVGFFRKGNLKWLADPIFKWGWIFPVLLVSQVAIFYFQDVSSLIGRWSNYIFLLIYIVGLVFLVVNREHQGIMIIFIGVFLNFIVMAVNGGRMPVYEEAAVILDPVYIDSVKEGIYAKHTILTESTKLAFLGDIIPITAPYPKSQVISIGDVIMNIGIFFFIQEKMIKHRQQKKETSSEITLEGGEIK